MGFCSWLPLQGQEEDMTWDIQASLKSLRDNKKPGPASPYQCAKYVNRALRDGGIHLRQVKFRYPGDGPSACDYGAYLEEAGFEVYYDNTEEDLACRPYHPLAGDIAIFMPIAAEIKNGHTISLHKHGHIQMFDGKAWISDFQQKQFFVGKDYRIKWGRFRVYRFTDLMCKQSILKVDFSR
jgi:hypothetical protein